MRGGEKKKLVAKKSNESKGKNLLLSSSRLYERIVHKNTYATNSYVIRVEQRNEVAIACGGREGGRGSTQKGAGETLVDLRFVVVVLRCTHVESFIVSFRWTILPEQFPEVERLPLWLRSGRFAPSNRRNCRLWGGGFMNREFNTRKTGIWWPCTWQKGRDGDRE